MKKLSAIPTNVITGFLGTGKTTAIQHLLGGKPANERWAVLVNEFGEVGIDGSLFEGRGANAEGVYIREVPGGCMCCTAGLPMQIALNMLLTRARPHRLLIEPTGLGHPREVLDALSADHYREVLDLQATLTLVDARKVFDQRYTSHATFNEQLAVADVIVANKSDLYQPGDFPALLDYLQHRNLATGRPVYQVSSGALEMDWLTGPGGHLATKPAHEDHAPRPSSAALQPLDIPEQGYLCISNEGQGFYSRGWVFKPEWVFDETRLYTLLTGIEAERLKAVIITSAGICAYNKADGVLSQSALDDATDSRIECISDNPHTLENLESALLDCVVNRESYSA